MHRKYTIALIVCALFLIGCRSTWTSSVGLDAAVYEANTYSIHVESERYTTYLVVPQATVTERFVRIGDHVYVTEELDDRTLEIRPVTPGAPMQAGAVEAEPMFADTLAEAAAGLSPYGVFASGAVSWLGEAPKGPVTVVAVDPGRISEGRYEIITAAGVFDGTVTWGDEPPADNTLVIPDGPAITSRPTLAQLGTEAQAVKPGWTAMTAGPLPPDDQYLYASKVSPIARRLGADLYVTIWNDRVYIGSTEPIQSRGVPYILGENPLGVGGTAAEVASELKALEALRLAKPLSAAGYFDPSDFDIHGNSEVTRIGILELLAEGGYYAYARERLVQQGPLTGFRRAIDARLRHRAGFDDARKQAAAAYEELLVLSGAAGSHALGTVALFVARLDAENGNWKTATVVAAQAADKFKEVRDSIRAAEAELFAGEAAIVAGEFESGEKLVNQARSRFYHGKSPYRSALTEVSLAHVYLSSGKSEDATKMADYAFRRFKASGDEVAQNRATVAMARAKGDPAMLNKAFATAVEKGDRLGALDAAAGMVERSGVPEGERRLALAVALARGFPHTSTPLQRLRASSAAVKICVSRGEWVAGLQPDDVQLVSLMCGTDLDIASVGGARAVDPEQIYSRLLSGEYEGARRMLGQMKADEEVSFEMAATLAIARFLIEEQGVDDVLSQPTAALDSVDPAKRPAALMAQAERAERAGAHALAEVWGGAAVAAVSSTDAGSPIEARARLAKAQVARLIRMQRALAANEFASRVTTGMAAVESSEHAAKALVAGYGAVAAQMVGASSDVRALREVVELELESVSEAELADVRSNLAWFAMRHGAKSLAEKDLKAAERALKKVNASERSATVVARIAVTEGFAARSANSSGTFKLVSLWFDNPGDDPEVAADLWRLTLESVPNDGLRKSFVARLDKAAEALQPAARGAKARDLLSQGEFAKAREIVKSGPTGANPTEALELDIRTAQLGDSGASSRQLTRLAQTTFNFDVGLHAMATLVEDREQRTEKWAKTKQTRRGAPDSEVVRAKLVEEAASSKAANASVAKKLQDELDAALESRDAAKIVAAVGARVDELVATGRADAAKTLLDRTATWFSKTEPESTAELERLRLAAFWHGFEPIETINHAYRVIEKGTIEDPSTRARFHLLTAKADFALGIDAHGLAMLRVADEAARTSGDRSLIKEVDALAKSLEIDLR